MTASRARVLRGIAAGRPLIGPQNVHIDVTNACNAACITCWDHSPLLRVPRPASWKRRSMPRARFDAIVAQLGTLGSVEAVVLSGMGDPLVHPDIYDLITTIAQRGWHLTLLSNLIAADPERLATAGVDQLLVGVHGARPETYAAFHPGWSETQFFRLCKTLRVLGRAGVRMRHVQVIDRNTAPDVPDMVAFGRQFGADRVNFKLASLAGGTERTAITADQLQWLREEGVPLARERARAQGVHTNLDLFETQLAAAAGAPLTTTPIREIGCYMGFVYTRITVDEDVLFCCNTAVKVGSLREADLAALWEGAAWQAARDAVAEGRYFEGCERCGKYEQNVKWAARVRQAAAS